MSLQLQIETTTACNARCVFCPYPGLKRWKTNMNRDLFERIIRDAETHAEDYGEVCLQGLGEPLLDPHILERIRFVRATFGSGVGISIYTNGSRLTPNIARELFEAGMTYLVISLNAATSEQRAATMGLSDWEQVTRTAETVRLRWPSQVQIRGIEARDLMDARDERDFRVRWGRNAVLVREGNWAGRDRGFRGAPHREPCGRALRQVMVLVDGRVSLCCFDAEGEVIVGDLRTQRLRDIWRGERAKYRELHQLGQRAEIPICARCTAI